MNDVELLKLQVEALEKLVKIKDDTISALQTQIALKPATTTQYVYWYYPYAVPSQWQHYPYYNQWPYYGAQGGINIPNYGGAGGAGGAGGTLQGQAGTGGGGSGVIFAGGAAQQGGNASSYGITCGSGIQTTGYMQTLDIPKYDKGSSN